MPLEELEERSILWEKIGKQRKSGKIAAAFDRNCDKTTEGFAYGFLGNTHRSLGNYEEALEMQKKFLEISKSTGDKAAEG